MHNEKNIIEIFYSAFKNLDAIKMNDCYNEDIIFYDPIFGILKNDEVKSMWQMLCKNATNFSLSFCNINKLDDEYYTCDWEATYIFSKTGKKIINKVKANMKILDGKIIEHSDAYSLHKWSAQALGFSGWLLGWNKFFQNKIKNQAKKQLLHFMQDKV